MKSLFLILLLSSAKWAWADEIPEGKFGIWPVSPKIIFISTSPSYLEWTIAKGSETYTLDEFVSGGKFCAWVGSHDLYDARYSCGKNQWACRLCNKCFLIPNHERDR